MKENLFRVENTQDRDILGKDKNASGLSLADRTDALQNAIDRAADGDTISLPEGIVRVQRPLIIQGKKNIKICGNHTRFLHTGYDMTACTPQQNNGLFLVDRSENITLENFSVDYAGFTSIAGTVEEKNVGETPWFLLRLYPEFASLTGEENYQTAMSFDPDGAPNYHLSGNGGGMSVKKVGKDLLKVFYKNAEQVQRLSAGEQINIRLCLNGAPVFANYASDRTIFRNITIYQAVTGSFLIGARSGSVTFDHVKITFREGTRQLMTSNSDAIHVKSMTGNLIVRDCVFDGLGDDAVNVHSRAGILDTLDPESRTVRFVDGWSKKPADLNWACEGDTIEFYDPATFLSKGTAKVQRYTDDTLRLDSVPESAARGDVIANLAYLPGVHISHTVVTRNRARAFLMQTRNVIIENCEMNRISLPAIIVAPDIQRWYEVGPAQNITIRNNTMHKCAFVSDSANMGAIVVKASHDAGYAEYPAGVHRDIVIENNTVEETANAGIFVSATRGLTVRKNTVSRYGTRKNILPTGEYAIYLVNCREVELQENRCDTQGAPVGTKGCTV